MRNSQPWIYGPFFDGLFILGIPFMVVAVVFALPAKFSVPDSMTVVSWAILVMGIDVSHVYSTLYRTYFDGDTRRRHALLLYLLPFAVLLGLLLLYAAGAMVFWRTMAYVAVFHFARQQYGFMRLYARSENATPLIRRVDAITIYTATLYPIIDWHLSGPKHFHWFMKGDFLYLAAQPMRSVFLGIYIAVIGTYALKEVMLFLRQEGPYPLRINIPRNLLILGTFLSWYVGIVCFDSDLAFTAINVTAHGIPYMALVWVWGRKKYRKQPRAMPELLSRVFQPRYVALFIGILLLFAYFEEGLWNTWVWHETEHADFFAVFPRIFAELPADSAWLGILVPLLSVPQVTHYFIDGFIWKVRDDRYGWRDTVFSREAGN